jgi:hypothetical protein
MMLMGVLLGFAIKKPQELLKSLGLLASKDFITYHTILVLYAIYFDFPEITAVTATFCNTGRIRPVSSIACPSFIQATLFLLSL